MKSKNRQLNRAKAEKHDEFYTQLPYIENELRHYKKHFKGKTVLCNCDDPRISNFFHYFSHNFKTLKLKKLITVCYKNQQRDLFSKNNSERAIYLEYRGDKKKVPDPDKIGIRHLKKDGDFRNSECVEILKKSDIVVTNPPFSLFREYVTQLMKHEKKFLIIGNQNAAMYKEIFPLIRDGKIWFGYHNGDMEFAVPDDYPPMPSRYRQDETGQKWRSMGNACWFTNIDVDKRHEKLILHKKYTPDDYPKFTNYDAINVSTVTDIPMDYPGEMGVPISFLRKHNPEQFKLVGLDEPLMKKTTGKTTRFYIGGRKKFARVVIRHVNAK